MLLHLIISILVASVLVLDLFLEISNGDVFIYWNNVMCFENMVLWQDIVTGEGAKVHDSHLKNPNNRVRKCKENFSFHSYIFTFLKNFSCSRYRIYV